VHLHALMCSFGTLVLPLGTFLLIQRRRGISWDDVLAGTLPPAIAEGRWAEAMAADVGGNVA
jgi:hypothetical protein